MGLNCRTKPRAGRRVGRLFMAENLPSRRMLSADPMPADDPELSIAIEPDEGWFVPFVATGDEGAYTEVLPGDEPADGGQIVEILPAEDGELIEPTFRTCFTVGPYLEPDSPEFLEGEPAPGDIVEILPAIGEEDDPVHHTWVTGGDGTEDDGEIVEILPVIGEEGDPANHSGPGDEELLYTTTAALKSAPTIDGAAQNDKSADARRVPPAAPPKAFTFSSRRIADDETSVLE